MFFCDLDASLHDSVLQMEGEKERQWQQQEEKESNEADDDPRSDDEDGHSERSVLDWQEGCDTDNLGLPIMQWEALSLRIAELEKQEEEKRLKVSVGMNFSFFVETESCPSRVAGKPEGGTARVV